MSDAIVPAIVEADERADGLDAQNNELACVSEAPRQEPLANPVVAYLESLSKNSRVTMRDCLRRLMRCMGKPDPRGDRHLYFPWWRLTPAHTLTLRRLLLEGDGGELLPVSASTTQTTLAGLRGVLHQCWRLGYIDADTFERVVGWPRVPNSQLEAPTGRMLTLEEVKRIYAAASSQPAFLAALDTAIVRLGLFGLRREEIALLQAGWLAASGTLRVLGKRRKVRALELDEETIGILESWLAQRACARGFRCLALFYRVTGRRAVDLPMTKWHVWDRCRELSRRSKVEFRPHDLRRTAASILVQTVDAFTAARILGHESPSTTARYDMRSKETQRKAAQALAERMRKGWDT